MPITLNTDQLTTTSSIAPMHADTDSLPDQRAHTKFFWTMLALSAAVSITGNATHTVLHASTRPTVAAVVAIVPPIALPGAIHGATILLRAHARARFAQLLATLMTMLIAVGAFRLSFTALRDLAISAAVPEQQAWLWPVIVEGSMAQATIALLACAHRRLPHTQRHTSATGLDTNMGSTGSDELTTDTTDLRADPPNQTRAGADNLADPTLEGVHTPTADRPPIPRWSRIAATICDRDPAHRRDPNEVAAILTRHYDHGQTPTQISHDLRRSRSTISRIISDAAPLRLLHDSE
ncbi:DUF2637 domain-containing protein [Nocardia yunnanensis]|uniref:DUF2637 domain-containing protein n=1 Tax=Nocardia yunnanensis TaxID=2382165 RepID=A0A386ZKS3_9NOCA|nr:DUF2637 domain-containing protein [Nocardia yunnanensis]AYF78462.1 DUF2637 domain-containing protein [Nocardia yunnanensis]